MASKTLKSKAKRIRRLRADKLELEVGEKLISAANGGDDSDGGQPRHPNPETPEEREKRLAARKALTIRAFQMTYENRRRRKAS